MAAAEDDPLLFKFMIDKLEWREDLEVPQPGPGEVLIKVDHMHAAGDTRVKGMHGTQHFQRTFGIRNGGTDQGFLNRT